MSPWTIHINISLNVTFQIKKLFIPPKWAFKELPLTCRKVRATMLSNTGPLSSCSKWTSSRIRSFTIWETATSPTLFLVTTSHFSGVVTSIYKTRKYIEKVKKSRRLLKFQLCHSKRNMIGHIYTDQIKSVRISQNDIEFIVGNGHFSRTTLYILINSYLKLSEVVDLYIARWSIQNRQVFFKKASYNVKNKWHYLLSLHILTMVFIWRGTKKWTKH